MAYVVWHDMFDRRMQVVKFGCMDDYLFCMPPSRWDLLISWKIKGISLKKTSLHNNFTSFYHRISKMWMWDKEDMSKNGFSVSNILEYIRRFQKAQGDLHIDCLLSKPRISKKIVFRSLASMWCVRHLWLIEILNKEHPLIKFIKYLS